MAFSRAPRGARATMGGAVSALPVLSIPPWRPGRRAAIMEVRSGPHGAPPGRSAAQAGAAPTVGDVVRHSGAVLDLEHATLLGAADVLLVRGSTAAAVVDERGELAGAITENDIVCAYSQGASPVCSVKAWLASGHARAPRERLGALTVSPTTSLRDAALRMQDARAAGRSACHHLVVKDENGVFRGILSSLDLAVAVCSADARQEMNRKIGGTLTAIVMKPRLLLPMCSSSSTLAQVLVRMIASRQNCVIIMDVGNNSSLVQGVITPRDALRGFAEQVPTDTEVGRWLRTLRGNWEFRMVGADVQLSEASKLMHASSMHHLVVVSPASSEVAGVISSLDLAQVVGAA